MTLQDAQRTVDMLAKLIRDIIDAGKLQETGTKNIVKQLGAYSAAIQQSLSQERLAKIQGKAFIKQLEKQSELKEKEMKQAGELIQLREKEKRITELTHADQVRRNIELRHSLENATSGLTMFRTALGGIGLVGGAGQGAFSLLGQFAANAKYRKFGQQKAGWQANMDTLRGRGLGKFLVGDELKDDMTVKDLPKNLQSDYLNFQEAKKQRDDLGSMQDHNKQFEFLRTHPTFKKLLDMSGRVQDFVMKHKTGIAISLVSLGLMVGMFKKIFEASPMMNKMFDLFKLMFDLTLRPIGDMFGFFLLPILRVVMASVLPMFARVYPKMIEFGLALGNLLTNNGQGFTWVSFLEAMGFVAEKIRPWDVLMWFFGQYQPTSADDAASTEAQALTLGGTGAGLAGVGVGAYGLKKGAQWGFNAIRNKKSTVDGSGGGGLDGEKGASDWKKSKWAKVLNSIKNRFLSGRMKGVDPLTIATLAGIAEEGAAVVLGKEDELERMQEERSENWLNQLLWNPDKIMNKFLPQAEATSIGHVDMHFHGSDFAGYPIETVGERQTEELAKHLGRRNKLRYEP